MLFIAYDLRNYDVWIAFCQLIQFNDLFKIFTKTLFFCHATMPSSVRGRGWSVEWTMLGWNENRKMLGTSLGTWMRVIGDNSGQFWGGDRYLSEKKLKSTSRFKRYKNEAIMQVKVKQSAVLIKTWLKVCISWHKKKYNIGMRASQRQVFCTELSQKCKRLCSTKVLMSFPGHIEVIKKLSCQRLSHWHCKIESCSF